MRQIFDWYLELGSLLAVVKELDERRWRTKAWITKAGKPRGNEEYDKARLHSLLTNLLYVGKVKHKENVYPGVHEAIVAEDVFAKVQAQLAHNGRHAGAEHRNRHGALLRGLLFCKACGRAMSHTFTTRGRKRYRYYTCTNVIKRGRRRCSTPSLPAAEIERVAVEQIACIGQDPAVLEATLEAARAQEDLAIKKLTDEKAILKRALVRCDRELRGLVGDESDVSVRRAAELAEQTDATERRLTEIDTALRTHRAESISADDVAVALADFDSLWDAMTPREQVRLVHLLVCRVEYDAADSSIEVSFHAAGIRALADEATSADADDKPETKPRSHKSKEAAA